MMFYVISTVLSWCIVCSLESSCRVSTNCICEVGHFRTKRKQGHTAKEDFLHVECADLHLPPPSIVRRSVNTRANNPEVRPAFLLLMYIRPSWLKFFAVRPCFPSECTRLFDCVVSGILELQKVRTYWITLAEAIGCVVQVTFTFLMSALV